MKNRINKTLVSILLIAAVCTNTVGKEISYQSLILNTGSIVASGCFFWKAYYAKTYARRIIYASAGTLTLGLSCLAIAKTLEQPQSSE